MAGTYNNVLELINNTPLVRLNKVTEGMKGEFFAKLECYNPGHSTKDRIALHIIENAEKQGILKPGSTIVETTSGNTGFSIAMVSIIKGYKCILAVSDKTKPEKVSFLKAMGAKVFLCPANVPASDPRSYYEVAKRIARNIPDSFYVNQYFNKENTRSHYLTTGPEIWEQTQGRITHLIGCTGTGGTLTGAAQFLKEKNPKVKIIGVDAVGSVLKKYFDTGELDPNEICPYQIEGLGKNLIPEALDFSVIDEYVKVSDEPSAYATRELALKEGMMVGYTSGACLTATRHVEDRFDNDSVVVLVFPDHGSRYMTKVFSDDWMKTQGFIESKLNGLETHAIIEKI
ncbi:MAG: pyridoxal-phosphate dependent enzyme [Flavobacteriaceae bacterium]|jgi:cystathionine beta-synthase|nr:pyridoxal-phosphate dependent enzyme [Flavobacteriaceae bacterium]